uniref:Uncharacterized protein n=1 Tax=viral metagenome TaxID=1070528 RepID=A0A6M3LE55_9ZZZZ
MIVEKVEEGSSYYWAFLEEESGRGVMFSCREGRLEETLLKDPYFSGSRGEIELCITTGNAGYNRVTARNKPHPTG